MSLMCDRNGGENVVLSIWIACGRPVPKSTPVSGDVDLCSIVWIGNNTISPFEAIALDLAPVGATVFGTIGGCIEARDVEDVGISRI